MAGVSNEDQLERERRASGAQRAGGVRLRRRPGGRGADGGGEADGIRVEAAAKYGRSGEQLRTWRTIFVAMAKRAEKP